MFQRICKIVLPGLVLFLSACTGNYEEYNTNGADATREDMNRDNYNVIANMLQLQSNVIPTNTHLFQYMESLCGGPYGGYTADVNPSFYLKGFACYNPDPSFYGFPFNNLTTAVWPAYLALRTNSTDPVILAVADVLKVAAMHRLTDMYGPIPYSKVPEGKLETEYDSQQTVYETMIRELDDAIAVLGQHRTESFTAKADRVYNGNIGQWAKYANSLKLRLALRLAYVDAARGAQMAGEVLASEVGTLESNADNPTLPLSKTHPMRQIMVEYQNGGDARLAADITSYMNGYEDPRREKFFVPSEFDDSAIEDGYHGLRIGIEMTDQAELQKYANINMETYDGSIVWMNAAEVAFLKAEAALRGWISGPARDYYEEGIRLSFDQYGVLGAEDYIANTTRRPSQYVDPKGTYSYSGKVSTVTVAWDEGADFETSLERIITQKWIANFPYGVEAWAEFRRTGYPQLMNVVINNSAVVNSDTKARRLPYPQEEYTSNYDNLLQILPQLGGPDNMATRVWWDCKNQ